ncbi:thioesterase II family protein [Amycolatopsis sp.]|jgi:surfactin synthase thioesterase subunit|uniref:thioesterase II family protein n=1 Tax=Amycolatopsis sp. TaxID=37632 RepID=UPI002DFA1404|nr:alpha/beta fold hydrolase [Amycolatopsis sp.]
MTAQPGATSAWIRRFHPAPDAATRLVCLPHAGGAASYYFPVSRALAPDIDVLAIQYPGRQDRRNEPCLDDVRELADALATELKPWTGKPVTVFGHSLGATLGFELASRLQSDGVELLGLFASGRRAPSRHRENESVHLSSDASLISTLKKMSGTESQFLDDDEVLQMILPAIRGDYKAAETYRYRQGPPLECPITVLTGDADTEVTMDEARAWSEHTTGAFDLRVFIGGHFYLNDHAPAVIARIAKQVADR